MKFFECFVPFSLQQSHRRAGGRSLKMYSADIDAEAGLELRIMVARLTEQYFVRRDPMVRQLWEINHAASN